MVILEDGGSTEPATVEPLEELASEAADGKIVKSYHIEDWAGALRQLSAK